MVDAVVVSGHGHYADPWHPFPATSQRIAEIVDELGYTVTIREDVEAALAAPGPCRLLVVNIGNPEAPRPGATIEAASRGLQCHLRGGGSLLGFHVSATSLTTLPHWTRILGGRWVRGVSMHPPLGNARINVVRHDHPVTSDLADFEVNDERYSYLETQPDITVLCEQQHDGLSHPVVWSRESSRSRVVYDGLGHDTRSFESSGHQQLIRNILRWLMP